MWLLKWWTRGRQLTLMPVSGRQELQPCSQIQPCPSVWAAFPGLTGCHWVFKGCLLGWELLHPGFSKGRERCIKKAFMGQLFGWEWEHHGICETHNTHNPHSSHRFTCQAHECLSPEFASFAAVLVCYTFWFVFLLPLCVICFPSVFLCTCSLPLCSDALLAVASRQPRWRMQAVMFILGLFKLVCLVFPFVLFDACVWEIWLKGEERDVGASLPGWVQAALSSHAVDAQAVSPSRQAGTRAVQHPLWAQRPPIGTGALWTKSLSYESTWEMQTKI